MNLKTIMLIVCGFLSLSLGAVGIFFPIMPTTPFVLISAACFSSSSPKLYNKLLNAKYFGEFVSNYKNKTGITLAVKKKSIIFLWIVLFISGIIFMEIITILILSTIGVAVTTHILLIKSK